MPLNRESDRQNFHQVYYCTSKKIYEHEDMIERAATKKKKLQVKMQSCNSNSTILIFIKKEEAIMLFLKDSVEQKFESI